MKQGGYPATLLPDHAAAMIPPESLIQYCLQKPQACVDFPFGPEPTVIKVGNQIFAEIYTQPGNYKITLKCDPSLADFYRQQFPGFVVRGYHCPPAQQPHRNTIWVEKIPDDLLFQMIDHSYAQVVKSLPQKVRQALTEILSR